MIHGPVGRRLVGKTTFADFLCRQCVHQVRFSPRITLPDRKGGVTYGVVPEPGDFAQLMDARIAITIVPEHDVVLTFQTLCHRVRRWYVTHESQLLEKHETVGFIIDEARFLNLMKREELADLDWLFRCTRPELVQFYLTVHRPKDLVPDIRAILDHWYVFHVTQKRDLEILADETSPLIAVRAEQLRPREFYHFDVGEQKAFHWPPSKAHVWKPEGEAVQRHDIAIVGQLDEGHVADDDWGLEG